MEKGNEKKKKRTTILKKKKKRTNYKIFLNNNKAIAFLKRAPRPVGVSKGREKSSFMFPLAQGCCSWTQAPLEQWDSSRKRNARRGHEKHISSSRGLWECHEPGPSPEPLSADQTGRAEALWCCGTKCISETDGLLQKLKTFFKKKKNNKNTTNKLRLEEAVSDK